MATEPVQEQVSKDKRLAMIRRENWCNYRIPCEERQHLLEEMKFWVNKLTTVELIEALPMIAQMASDDELTDPFIEIGLEPGENPAETKPGLILLPHNDVKKARRDLRSATGGHSGPVRSK